MNISRLTDKKLKSIKPKEKRFRIYIDSRPGLFLLVNTTGRITFQYRYQLDGKRQETTLGTYSGKSGSGFSLSQLLKLYEDFSEKVTRKIDPVEAKRKEDHNPTIKEFSVEYLENCESRKLSPKTIKEYRRIFDKYIFKKHGKLPSLADVKMSELRRREISLLVNYIAHKMPNTYRGKPATGAPTQSNRVLAVISGLCKYAIENELLEYNPALAVRKPGKVNVKDRYLTMNEIKTVHDIVNEFGTRLIYDAFMLALLTGQRLSQIATLRMNYIKDDLIEFPAKVMKGGKQHKIFLSSQVKQIIEQRKADGLTTDFVFPGAEENPHAHPDSLKRALARLQPSIKAAGVPKFSFHDLRRTLSTNLNRLGYRGVDKAILSHSATGVTDVHYNRYDLAGEIKTALTVWSEAIKRAIAGTQAEVIPIFKSSK